MQKKRFIKRCAHSTKAAFNGFYARRARAIEKVKNALLALLLFSMAVMAVLLILRTQRMTVNKPVDVDVDRLLTLKNSDRETITAYSAERVTPEFFAYRDGKTQRALFGPKSLMSGAVSVISDALTCIFGSNAAVSETKGAEGEELWLSCLEAERFIYLKLRSPLPAPVLRMFVDGRLYTDRSYEAQGEIYYLSDMFILPAEKSADGRCSVRAVARDGGGRIIRYECPDPALDFEMLSTYGGNTEFVSFKFARQENPLSIELDPCCPIIKTELPVKCISVSTSLAPVTAVHTNELLSLFGYNPNRLNRYNDPDTRSDVYIETWGTLRFETDRIQFSATGESGGISISDYLPYGYSAADYNIYELFNCSENFLSMLSAIDNRLTGGDASPVLDAVFAENESVVIRYRCCFDNLSLDSERAIELTFSGDKITKIRLDCLIVSNLLTRQKTFTMPTAFIGAEESSAATDDGVGPSIRLIYTVGEEEGVSVTASWALSKRTDDLSEAGN
ncbi:MAG: hypothetical protein GX897_01275 [Clostridiales bacterium]|nr:hypothetical protein [Clostridiales bacterium]